MSKKIEDIQVTKAFLPPIDEFINEIKPIWNSHWLTNNGNIHNKLQNELEEYLKVNNIVLTCNGHLAIDIAIKSLKLKGEVITTPFTFASTVHNIVENGLTPVFCDIKLDDYTIDEDKIESLITPRTSAIIPVHVFGNPCNVEKINKIAQKHGLKVIYDAAHAFGVEINGQGIGNFGDASAFSFHATKVFNTIEGGAVAVRSKELKCSLDMLKNFGITGQESVEIVGINAKMNEFESAMGLANLKYMNYILNERKRVTELYDKFFGNIAGIKILKHEKSVKYNYSYYSILLDEKELKINRNEMFERLKEYGIYTRKYFYPLVTDFECYTGKYDDSNLINSKYVADRILTLPIYPELSNEEINRIENSICNVLEKVRG